MKKTIALILMTLILALTLASCGESTKTTETNGNDYTVKESGEGDTVVFPNID